MTRRLLDRLLATVALAGLAFGVYDMTRGRLLHAIFDDLAVVTLLTVVRFFRAAEL